MIVTRAMAAKLRRLPNAELQLEETIQKCAVIYASLNHMLSYCNPSEEEREFMNDLIVEVIGLCPRLSWDRLVIETLLSSEIYEEFLNYYQ